MTDEVSASTSMNTRERILQEATRLFSEKGSAASVRDICHAAKANASAINYHFGSKEDLLAEVLSHYLNERLDEFPIHGDVDETAPAEERLFGFLKGFLSRLIFCESIPQEGNKLVELLSNSFLSPFPAFEEYVKAHRLKHKNCLLPILQELLGPDLPTMNYVLVARSIVSQALFYSPQCSGFIAQTKGASCSLEEIDAIARHITIFSTKGIQNYAPQQNLDQISFFTDDLPAD